MDKAVLQIYTQIDNVRCLRVDQKLPPFEACFESHPVLKLWDPLYINLCS